MVLAREDITDDSSDEDAAALRNRVRKIMTKQAGKMNPMCRLILFRWLGRTRRRLGIPDLLIVADNISEEESSTDEQAKHQVRPEISTKAQAIARFWRGMLEKQVEKVEPAVQVSDDSGSDDQSKGIFDRLITNHVKDIARLWLQQMREEQNSGGVRRVQNIVSDESDAAEQSDEFDMNAVPTFGRNAIRTAPVSSDTGTDTGSSMTAPGGTTSSHGPDERVPAPQQRDSPKASARLGESVPAQEHDESPQASARSANASARSLLQPALSEPEEGHVPEVDEESSKALVTQQDSAAPAAILPKTRRIARMWLDMMNDALSSRRSSA